jgi:hypothetical protein
MYWCEDGNVYWIVIENINLNIKRDSGFEKSSLFITFNLYTEDSKDKALNDNYWHREGGKPCLWAQNNSRSWGRHNCIFLEYNPRAMNNANIFYKKWFIKDNLIVDPPGGNKYIPEWDIIRDHLLELGVNEKILIGKIPERRKTVCAKMDKKLLSE